MNEIFAVQDEITAAIISAILPALSDAEQQRALRRPPEHLSAWEAYQRGLWYIGKNNLSDLVQVQQFFQQASEIDPMFAPACSAMATSYVYEGGAYATRPLVEAGEMAEAWARRAVAIDPNDAEGQAALAWRICLTGNLANALERLSLALRINPNSVWAHVVKGAALLFQHDRRSEAREAMLAALRLSPRDPLNVIPSVQIGILYYLDRDYVSALEASKRVVTRYPDFPLTYRFWAASLGQLGHSMEAQAALRQAIDLVVREQPGSI